MLKCIMFDVSGTLMDSENNMLFVDKKFLIPWLNRRGYDVDIGTVKALRGKYPTKEFYINLLKEMRWKMEKKLFKEMVDLFMDFYFVSLKPFPGVVSTLNYLRKKGIMLVVVSNSRRKYVDKSLEKLDFKFDSIFSHDQTKSRKSSLEPFQYSLKSLGLKPEECLVVGDRLDEDAFCRKMGIKFVWFPQNKSTANSTEGYDFFIRDFGELKKLADSLLELKD
jgi:HAD superfamily hydrolase (TIGR01662 family)